MNTMQEITLHDLYRISMHYDGLGWDDNRLLGHEHLAELRLDEDEGYEMYFPLCNVGRRIADGWCVEARIGLPLCKSCQRLAGTRTVFELT